MTKRITHATVLQVHSMDLFFSLNIGKRSSLKEPKDASEHRYLVLWPLHRGACDSSQRGRCGWAGGL